MKAMIRMTLYSLIPAALLAALTLTAAQPASADDFDFTAVLIGGWSRSREISVCAGGRLAEVTPSVVRAGWFVRACGWGWMVAGCL